MDTMLNCPSDLKQTHYNFREFISQEELKELFSKKKNNYSEKPVGSTNFKHEINQVVQTQKQQVLIKQMDKKFVLTAADIDCIITNENQEMIDRALELIITAESKREILDNLV